MKEVIRWGLEDAVAPRIFGGLLAGRHHQVLAPFAPVRTGQAQVGDRTLPHVEDAAGRRTFRVVDHQRACPLEVHIANLVGRGVVWREESHPVTKTLELYEIAILLAEHGLVLLLPLGEGDDRHRPEVSLGSALEIQLVVQFAHSGVSGIPPLER